MNGLLIAIFIIGSITVGALILWIIAKLHREKWYSAEDIELASFVVMMIFLIAEVMLVCLYPSYMKPYKKYVTNILSISRGSSVEGRFVLGTGSISEISYYFYYYETDKGIKLGKVEAYNTYIVETAEQIPSLYEMKESNSFDIYNTLYVPIGTVMTNFVLE